MVAGQEFFESKPDVRGEELCVTGTRISVTVILDSLAEGSTKEEILRSYPFLNPGAHCSCTCLRGGTGVRRMARAEAADPTRVF